MCSGDALRVNADEQLTGSRPKAELTLQIKKVPYAGFTPGHLQLFRPSLHRLIVQVCALVVFADQGSSPPEHAFPISLLQCW
jgi:hypothetical protein